MHLCRLPLGQAENIWDAFDIYSGFLGGCQGAMVLRGSNKLYIPASVFLFSLYLVFCVAVREPLGFSNVYYLFLSSFQRSSLG